MVRKVVCVARILFFWGGIKLQHSCSIAVPTSFLPHKRFTWTDFFLGGYYTHIPRRYAPGLNSVSAVMVVLLMHDVTGALREAAAETGRR